MDKPRLLDRPWYYGSITRNVCDNLLNQFGHDGDFLIRDSETNVSTIFNQKFYSQISNMLYSVISDKVTEIIWKNWKKKFKCESIIININCKLKNTVQKKQQKKTNSRYERILTVRRF